MIFVVEGPDGAGKSTLVKSIRAQAKIRHVQCHFLSSSGPPASLDHIQNEVDWLSIAPRTMNLFCDRHRFISEPIYGLIVRGRSEEHTSELQSRGHLVCRLLLEKKKQIRDHTCHGEKKKQKRSYK